MSYVCTRSRARPCTACVSQRYDYDDLGAGGFQVSPGLEAW